MKRSVFATLGVVTQRVPRGETIAVLKGARGAPVFDPGVWEATGWCAVVARTAHQDSTAFIGQIACGFRDRDDITGRHKAPPFAFWLMYPRLAIASGVYDRHGLHQGSEMMATMYRTALEELGAPLDRMDAAQVDRAVETIAAARHITVYAGGREGLQVRGFAMRLFHLGRSVSVVGDMTTPAVGAGDLFLNVCGPGEISTALALVGVAKTAGAKVLVITAQPQGRVSQMADEVLVLPAQTMANDQGPSVSLLPMGSVFEGALFVLFEVMILKLKAVLDVSTESMRANHTNME